MPMLEIKGLFFLDYGPFDLCLESGEVFGIRGESGSGKTLFLKAVADLIESSGQVLLNGVSRDRHSGPDWRKQVMLVPSEAQWWHETVGQHFTVEANAVEWAKYGLKEEVASWSVSQLSSGEKQRLGLARAITRKPVVLLLDEPTANLDRDNALRLEGVVLQYLKDMAGAAIWVSHSGEQLRRGANRRAVMEGKQLGKEMTT